MTDYEADIIICGGGPSGMGAAYTLAKAEKSIIVFDKKPHNLIGNKVCGDALNPSISDEVYNLVGLPKPDPAKQELVEYLDKMILAGKRESSTIKIGGKSATVDRLRYGQALIHAVEEFSSVQVVGNARVIEPLVENMQVIGVKVSINGKEKTAHAKIVIDATGINGIVRRRLPENMCTKFPRKTARKDILISYREIIKTKEPHQFQHEMLIKYEPEMDPVYPGYYWFFSRGTHELNIGLGYFIDKKADMTIKEMNEKIRRRYFKDDEIEIIESQGAQIPARLPLQSLVHNGFMIVGDAGAFANPMNGEGHGPALISGINAAFVAISALNANDVSEKALWDYNKFAWKRYGSQYGMGLAMINFVNKLGYDQFDWLLSKKVITEEDILDQLDEKGISNREIIKRAMKIIYKPKILFYLKKTISYADNLKKHSLNYPDYENFNEWNAKLEKLLKY